MRQEAQETLPGRLLVVGWPGADWHGVVALIGAGSLPHLAGLAAGGCVLSLAAPPPRCHAALWTTLATGMLADRHGVLTDQERRPDGGGVQDAGQRSWRALAFWEVLEQAGLRTACVGWPATAPGARWPGRHVDERFGRATGSSFETWAMPPDAVAPAALRHTLRGLRIHPADGLRSQVLALLPEAAVPDPRHDQRPLLLGAALAQVGTMHAVATHWAEEEWAEEKWDVLCTCHDLLRLIGPGGAAGAGGTAEPDAGLRARAYALQDMMLGRLVQLAGAGATVMVVATGDGGPHQPGFLVASGDGILPGPAGRAIGAALTDVAPTILSRFGLLASGDGVPIPALSPQAAAPLRHAATPVRDAVPPATLVAHGAPDALEPGQAAALQQQEAGALLGRAEVQMARGDLALACLTLEALRVADPRNTGALRCLAECRGLLGDAAACLPLAQALLELEPRGPWGHVAMAAWCILVKDPGRAQPHLDCARALAGTDPAVLLRLGGLQLLRGCPREAASLFEAAAALAPGSPDAFYGLGVACSAAEDLPAAERALCQAIALQPVQPLAHLQHAAVLAAQGRWRDSLAAVETALQQRPGLPGADLVLTQARTGLARQIAAAALDGDRSR